MAKTKFGKATDRARGNEPETEADFEACLEADGMLSSETDADWHKALALEDLEEAPRMLTLKEGQTVSGILEAYGGETEIIDRTTGIAKMVGTWIIASRNGRSRVSILDSAQLAKKLPSLVGDFVRIRRCEDEKLPGAKQLTHYSVAGPTLRDENNAPARRDWINGGILKPGAAGHALPAGNDNTKQGA